MNKNVRFPFRFFLITFMWSWIIWTPLILASLKIIPVSEKLLSILTIPVIMIGVFGPLAGALFALHKEKGKGSTKIYLRSFLDFRLLIVGYSYILSWIRKISGNRPFSGLYAHGLANAFIPLVPTLIMQKNVYQPRFWIWVSLTFIIGIIITIIRERKATTYQNI